MTMSREDVSDQAKYEIRAEGHIGDGWSSRFEGLTVESRLDHAGKPLNVLAGVISDQAALHGQVARIRDLGLTLLLVRRIEAGSGTQGGLASREFW
ncbi:MAG TPA: hypothetical protein DCP37_04125 [Dehalococcoidia bacterium]|nr:hypothetical protein [Dehalococcoidia bacterium]